MMENSMTFKDQWVTDESGNKFVFTVEMQRRLSEAGLPLEPASLDSLQEGNHRPPSRPTERKKAQPETADDDLSFTAPSDIQIDPETGKYIGRVKWYNTKKGVDRAGLPYDQLVEEPRAGLGKTRPQRCGGR
jgi:hypothetical protein